MEYDHDFLDVAPTTSLRNGLYWQEKVGILVDPYIDYTAGVAAVADNATFF